MKITYNDKEYELILLCVTGSRMYGTHYEKGEHPFNADYISDYDYRGVFISNPTEKLGLIKNVDQIAPNPEEDAELNDLLINEINKKTNLNLEKRSDIVLYEVDKFIKLALEENPNILDILYMDDESKLYSNKKGEKIIQNRDLFITKNVIDKFIGYADAQLKRMRNHNKYINKLPDYAMVKKGIHQAYNNAEVDYNWINVHFSGDLASDLTGKTQQDANSDEKIETISMEELREKYIPSLPMEKLRKYAKPKIINYLTLKDFRGRKLQLDEVIHENMTVEEVLLTKSSFRKITDSVYNIFSSEKIGGVITKNNDVKTQEPKETGSDLLFHCSINKAEFKVQCEEVRGFWHWLANRNKKRSQLEEKFGYDTKHGSHLCRLMTCALELSENGIYTPRLTGKRLKLAKDIIEGKYTYNQVVTLSENLKRTAKKNKETSILPNEKDIDKINEIVIKLNEIKKNINKPKIN